MLAIMSNPHHIPSIFLGDPTHFSGWHILIFVPNRIHIQCWRNHSCLIPLTYSANCSWLQLLIHVNPHYWKRSSSIVPSFFRPICWMATETSSDGEMQVFHMFQAKQLGGFAFALVLNAELIRFSRNNKGAKIFVEFSSIPFGDVFFSVFIWGLGICGKHRKGHVFRQFARLFAV